MGRGRRCGGAPVSEIGTEPRLGFAGWWDGLGRAQRIAAVAAALIVGVNVVLVALGTAVGQNPGGPVSSSFSTGVMGSRPGPSCSHAAIMR